jgi:hypothetical protein
MTSVPSARGSASEKANAAKSADTQGGNCCVVAFINWRNLPKKLRLRQLMCLLFGAISTYSSEDFAIIIILTNFVAK